jgi:tetratricopeptide (TPR) repeat protein
VIPPGFRRRSLGKDGERGEARITAAIKTFVDDSLRKSLAIVALVAAAALSAGILGIILRLSSPQSQLTVSAFHIYEVDTKSQSEDGKVLADLLVDDLHRVLERANDFSGNPYSSKNTFFSRLPDIPQIPVDTSYGIEIKGVSLDNLIATWNRLRYKEYVVAGDLMPVSADASLITVRYETHGSARSYERRISKAALSTAESALEEISVDLVQDINPEAAARYMITRAFACEVECGAVWESVVQFCWKWVKAKPDDAMAPYYLGYALVSDNRAADALPFLDQSLRMNPRSHLALNARGMAMANLGRFADAASDFSNSIKLRRTANPIMNLGVLSLRQGNFPLAASKYREALSVDPVYAGAFLNLGGVLIELRDYQGAAEAFRKVLDLEPANGIALYGLARSLPRLGKLQEAISRCQMATELEPSSPWPLLSEGVVLIISGPADDGIKKLNLSLSKGNLFETHVQLGIGYMNENDLDDAAKKFDDILKESWNVAFIHVLKAKLLERKGDRPMSNAEMSAAERIDPAVRFEVAYLDELTPAVSSTGQ